MNIKNRTLHIWLGPILFAVCYFALQGMFSVKAAKAIGIALWMIYWWVSRPVNITVTAFVPIVANALFDIIPMKTIIVQYFSESIILILGSGFLTVPWSSIGLDKRISLKALSLIGPSMKSQITVWLLSSIILSNLMPNVVVCALMTPIAVGMLKAAGYDGKSEAAIPILCAIGWGVGIGGVGTPLGGAMNITAIALLQDFTGKEFMYIDWMTHLTPYTLLVSVACLAAMLLNPGKIKQLEGTKEYFKKAYNDLGPMKGDEKLCLAMFLLGLAAVFFRPLYAHILPRMVPAYVFLILGFICFFLTSKDSDRPLMTWEEAQKESMWGMMILFAGGLAMGVLLSGSGANEELAQIVAATNLQPGLPLIIAITILACLVSETTNSTVSAAVTVPIVMSVTAKMHLDLMTYWYIAVMAFNSEFLLPVSVRSIPVAYGLSPDTMLRKALPVFLVRALVVIICSYVALQIPGFGK